MVRAPPDPETINEWRQAEASMLAKGICRKEAHRRLAADYDKSLTTIYYWLTPEYREKKTRLQRARYPENKHYIHAWQARQLRLSSWLRRYDKELRDLSEDILRDRELPAEEFWKAIAQVSTVPKYKPALRALADLLSVDEVQNGFYRLSTKPIDDRLGIV